VQENCSIVVASLMGENSNSFDTPNFNDFITKLKRVKA
jgi:hypothetical protein